MNDESNWWNRQLTCSKALLKRNKIILYNTIIIVHYSSVYPQIGTHFAISFFFSWNKAISKPLLFWSFEILTFLLLLKVFAVCSGTLVFLDMKKKPSDWRTCMHVCVWIWTNEHTCFHMYAMIRQSNDEHSL